MQVSKVQVVSVRFHQTHARPIIQRAKLSLKHSLRVTLLVVGMPQYVSFLKIPTVRLFVKLARETRLTYNCAHLRSTKESLTVEYLRRKLYFLWRRRRMEKEKEENIKRENNES